ncbi:hypothetical protein RRG08_037334 [Elysia crispata]|uniref:Uncharacterized protein n=1 Tax=Elysia crispata TaxID=231223 RepID=A0AAE1AG86_9GAST|nr:hypothetical protein RRG08_037334 [Elysia crispata]
MLTHTASRYVMSDFDTTPPLPTLQRSSRVDVSNQITVKCGMRGEEEPAKCFLNHRIQAIELWRHRKQNVSNCYALQQASTGEFRVGRVRPHVAISSLFPTHRTSFHRVGAKLFHETILSASTATGYVCVRVRVRVRAVLEYTVRG